ncbi:IclR family transcriptional regulator [Streptomyces sp. MP131-18]|uniref:IclR family transcriptional regulator n=1 Tax=Streptomyces sp. MP131-18 TaxID=1857892 RepID=UPI00097BF58D|nr:IclR family transcriptional regulator [Streptomyces sp. MP131-18]ONK15858.1 YiaKLMNOPQRS operon repressor [Streptomyces sp. MP131-18]
MSQTVARALDIVGFVAERPRSLGETAALLGVHKSTALRLLRTLETAGFARRRPDGSYAAGFRVIALAQQVLDQLDVREIAHPHLAALAESCGHTVHLAALEDDEIVYLDKVDGSGPTRLRSRIGRPAVLHTAAVSKAILAHLEPPLRERLLARADFAPLTPTTITRPEALRAELAAVADRGWAEDDAEGEPFVNCLALPLWDATGRVRAAMSVTALAAVAPLPALRERLADLRAVGERVSRELGWAGPPAADDTKPPTHTPTPNPLHTSTGTTTEGITP